MITWQQLQASYGQSFSLRLSDQTIQAGERIAIIGPSGCGKTTLLQLIAGILVPSHGQLNVNEYDLTTLDDAKRRRYRCKHIGLMSQRLALLPHLTVQDNITLPLQADRQAITPNHQAYVETLLSEVNLSDKAKRYPHQLSQGESQRVALCRALVYQPNIILADEPTGNLDSKTADQCVDAMLKHSQNTGATLLVVTHDNSQLDRFDRVLDMSEIAS